MTKNSRKEFENMWNEKLSGTTLPDNGFKSISMDVGYSVWQARQPEIDALKASVDELDMRLACQMDKMQEISFLLNQSATPFDEACARLLSLIAIYQEKEKK